VDTSYLPAVEQRRREAWRARMTLDDENESDNGHDDDGHHTPTSGSTSPLMRKKRSLRSLLTPVMSERDFTNKDGEGKKKKESAVPLFDEEDDRKNLMRRWKSDSRPAKPKVSKFYFQCSVK
jgi:hypothetical protein